MDWELENENLNLKDMIIVYEQEIKRLTSEKETLQEEVKFLKLQLEYKTMGPPIHSQDDKKN